MDKFVIFIALLSFAQAAYISRMASVGRFRGPTAFRPGVILQRPHYPARLMPASSHRTPFVIYRNVPHRYAMKPMNPVITRNVFGIPWKTTARVPVPVAVTPDYDYARAAPSQPVIRTDGAIHTIPAPNLSLSERPIVVAEVGISDNEDNHSSPEMVKPTYEVTENNGETQTFKVQSKFETPSGFLKINPNYESNIHNDATQQFNPEYVQIQQSSVIPQEFSIQKFNGLPSHQDLIQAGAEGLIIPPNAFYQSDPLFLQKLQNQLLQKYPAVEFIPYTPDVQTQVPLPTQQFQPTQFYFENDRIIKQQPMSFVVSDNNRNIVQRQTQEGTVESLVPTKVITKNITETPSLPEVTTINILDTTISYNVTTQTTTTEKIKASRSVENRTNPIYYTLIDHNISNILPSGFQSAKNNIKDTSTQQPNETNEESTTKSENTTTPSPITTVETKLDLDNKEKLETNEILKEYTNFVASPFEKPAESVNIAYTILRASDKDTKVVQNGSVLAGQLVEASVSEDKDFHKERALLNRHHSMPEKNVTNTTSQQAVKAKIPPKSKLTFDDKTGEPILRVYASYVDSPARKEVITTKLTNLKHLREAISKRQEHIENVNAATVNALATDINQFGLKIKSKSTDSIHILDEYNK